MENRDALNINWHQSLNYRNLIHLLGNDNPVIERIEKKNKYSYFLKRRIGQNRMIKYVERYFLEGKVAVLWSSMNL